MPRHVATVVLEDDATDSDIEALLDQAIDGNYGLSVEPPTNLPEDIPSAGVYEVYRVTD